MIINPIISGGKGAAVEIDGTALPADVLAGKTFYNTDPTDKETGSMANKAGTSAAAASEMASSQYRLKIPAAGYYDENAKIYRSYANVAADIGLTAGILAKGSTVLGIAGSMSADMKFASVSFGYTSGTRTVTISGLAFRPRELWFLPDSRVTGNDSVYIARIVLDANGAAVSANSVCQRFAGREYETVAWTSSTFGTISSTASTASGATITFSSTNNIFSSLDSRYHTCYAMGLG